MSTDRGGIMPKGHYPLNKKVSFVCDRCGGPALLSARHYRDRRDACQDCFCKPCRSWQQRQNSILKNWNSIRSARAHESVTMNGCTLVATDRGRCEGFDGCPGYMACLNAVARLNWGGWKVLKGGNHAVS